jgi:CcmD family protein
MNPYLFAAYAATWIIHITYLSILAGRYARLRREVRGLKEKSNPKA